MSTQVINTRYEILETAAARDTPPFVLSKARDREEGRVVTLQVLPAEVLGTSQALRQEFQAAVREAQRLEYADILKVYDQGVAESGGDLYVVREYMRGITLQERIRRIAPFTLAVAVDIAVAVTESLVAAHRAGVPHADLRPLHVLLSPEGQIKVTDFVYGAVAAARADDPTRAAYLAPELSRADAGSFAADVYALGAMLYEMLTGALPLVGTVRVTSPRDLNPGVPPALNGIVQKAMHSDLGVRYRSSATLLADLQTVRESLRTGKSLAWSPLAEKRAPRPSATETTVVAPRPAGATETPAGMPPVGAIASAARELDEERYGMREREPSAALGIALKALFVIAILGVIGLSWYATQFFAVPNDVQVPNLIGKTFDDAKRIAAQDHFNLVESTDSNYTDTMPENQIYQQDPPPNHTIKANKDVIVYRSRGPSRLTVPSLVGTMQDVATAALVKANIQVGSVSQDYNERVPAGVVISQSLEGGSKVDRNSAINFVVSKGKQPPDAPAEVQATASGLDKVDINWKAANRAEAYTVTRSLDGDVTTLPFSIKDTHFSDTGLNPETTYSYTITAVNSAGSSNPSDPALVTTQAKIEAPLVLPPDTTITLPPDVTPPPDQTPPISDHPGTTRLRQFTIVFPVPRHPRRTRHVQIEIQDTTGTNLVYDENHEPGEDVSAPVQGIGNKVTFRIFLDNKLVKQQTF